VDGVTRLALLAIEEGEFGRLEVPFHGTATTLFLITIGGEEDFGFVGIAGEGSILFDEPPVIGEPVSLQFSADLWLDDGSSFGPLGGAPP